jgi:hypothetical protein
MSDGKGGLTYHESRAPSDDPVDLKIISVTAGSGSTGWLIQVKSLNRVVIFS